MSVKHFFPAGSINYEKFWIAWVLEQISSRACNDVMMQNSHPPVVSLSVCNLFYNLMKNINGLFCKPSIIYQSKCLKGIFAMYSALWWNKQCI